jgi:hypothetical protein
MPFRDRLEWASTLADEGNARLAALTDAEIAALVTPLDFITFVFPDWEVKAQDPTPGFHQFLLAHRTEPWWAVYSILGADLRFGDPNPQTRRAGIRVFNDAFILGETQDEFITLFAAANQPFGLRLAEWVFNAIDTPHSHSERFILALAPQPGFTQID